MVAFKSQAIKKMHKLKLFAFIDWNLIFIFLSMCRFFCACTTIERRRERMYNFRFSSCLCPGANTWIWRITHLAFEAKKAMHLAGNLKLQESLRFGFLIFIFRRSQAKSSSPFITCLINCTDLAKDVLRCHKLTMEIY